MKALKCDLCGSVDIIKKDGFFQCEHCGCKYDLEEAKKMLIEGTVDVSGSTVKIDNSQEINNLYTLARRARASGDIEEVKKYYEQILLKKPNDWEAMYCVDVLKIQLPASRAFNYSELYERFYEHIIIAISAIETTSEQAKTVKQLYGMSDFMIGHLVSLLKTYRKSLFDKGVTGGIVKNLTNLISGVPATKPLIAYHIGSYALSILGDNYDMRNVALELWKDALEYASPKPKQKNDDLIQGFVDMFKPVTPIVVDKKTIELLKYKINQYTEPKNGASNPKEQKIPELIKPQKKSIFSKLETLGQSNKQN